MNYNGIRDLTMDNEQAWGTNTLERIETALGRKLKDYEVAEILVFAFGYFDSTDRDMQSLVRNLNLERYFSDEDVEKLNAFVEEENE